jgi:hypothetical protein
MLESHGTLGETNSVYPPKAAMLPCAGLRFQCGFCLENDGFHELKHEVCPGADRYSWPSPEVLGVRNWPFSLLNSAGNMKTGHNLARTFGR